MGVAIPYPRSPSCVQRYSCVLECSTPGRWRCLVGVRPTGGFKSLKGSGATPMVLVLELSRRDKNSVWKGWKFPASPCDALWFQKESVMPEQSQPGRASSSRPWVWVLYEWIHHAAKVQRESSGKCTIPVFLCPKRSSSIKFFRFSQHIFSLLQRIWQPGLPAQPLPSELKEL